MPCPHIASHHTHTTSLGLEVPLPPPPSSPLLTPLTAHIHVDTQDADKKEDAGKEKGLSCINAKKEKKDKKRNGYRTSPGSTIGHYRLQALSPKFVKDRKLPKDFESKQDFEMDFTSLSECKQSPDRSPGK